MNHPMNRPHLRPWLAAALLLNAALACAAPATQVTTTASRPWQGLWQGQIGSQRVVVALYEDDQRRVAGRYFYDRYGRDLTLWGPEAPLSSQAAAMDLQECPPDYGSASQPCDAPSARWSLHLPKPGPGQTIQLTGALQAQAQAGRRPPPSQPITLQRLGDYSPNAEAFGDRYEQLRARGQHTQRRTGGTLGPIQWDWLQDTRAKVSTPQFTKGAAPEVLQRINQAYAQQWRERISQALTAVDYEDDVKVVYANPRWLATQQTFGFYFAGAAHPSSGFASTTHDLQTGQVVDWRRVFRLTDPKAETLDLTRKDLLAAQVLKAMKAQVAAQPIEGKRPDGTESADDSCPAIVLKHYGCQGSRCASEELMAGHTPSDWWIWPTDQGLAVSPDVYAEVERACRGEHVVLPWPQVRATLVRPQVLP